MKTRIKKIHLTVNENEYFDLLAAVAEAAVSRPAYVPLQTLLDELKVARDNPFGARR